MDTQAVVNAPPESSPTTTVEQGTQSHNQVSIAAAQLKCHVPIFGFIVSTFDIYLAFRNDNEM